MKLQIVILAAGQGTRMFSSLPKALHRRLGGKPLLAHVLEAAASLDHSGIHAVIGHGAELVRQTFESPDFPFAGDSGLNWVLQERQLGTGHAVQQAMPQVDADLVLVLYGDVPLVRPDTLRDLVARADPDSIALLTLETRRAHRASAESCGTRTARLKPSSKSATPTRNRNESQRSTVA